MYIMKQSNDHQNVNPQPNNTISNDFDLLFHQASHVQTHIPLDPSKLENAPSSLEQLDDDDWTSSLMSCPKRSTAYCDEVLEVYLTLTIPTSSTEFLEDEAQSRKKKLEFFKQSLSVQFEAYCESFPKPSISTRDRNNPLGQVDTTAAGLDLRDAQGSPLASNGDQEPSHTCSTMVDQPTSSPEALGSFKATSETTRLFTATYPDKSPSRSSAHQTGNLEDTSKASTTYHQTISSMRLGKIKDDWVIVWKIQGKISPIDVSDQPMTLALSSIITYRSLSSQRSFAIDSSMGGSSTIGLSSNPQVLDNPSRSGPSDEYNFGNIYETNLLQGLGLDLPLPHSYLSPKISLQGSSSRASFPHPSESQVKHTPRPHLRSMKSTSSPRSTSASLSSALPPRLSGITSSTAIPEAAPGQNEAAKSLQAQSSSGRRLSAPSELPIPLAASHHHLTGPKSEGLYGEAVLDRTMFSTSDYATSSQLQQSPKLLEAEKRHHITLAIICPLSLDVRTAVVQHNNKSTPSYLPHQISFTKQPDASFMLLLDIGNIRRRRIEKAPADDEMASDFILEDVKIVVQNRRCEDGLSEDEQLGGQESIQISLLGSDVSSGSRFPIRVPDRSRESLIYKIKPDSSHDRNQGDVILPPSTPISDVTIALRHEKRGIHLDVEQEPNLPSAISVFDEAQECSSTVWLGNKKQTPIDRVSSRSYQSPGFNDDRSQQFSRSEAEYDVTGKPNYVLEVQIKGKVTFGNQSTGQSASGTIVARWTAVIGSEFQRSTKLNLQRRSLCSKPIQNEETSVLSPFIPNSSRQDSLVVGSRKHTASELAGVLSKFSNFQYRLSASSHQNEDERSNHLTTPSIEPDGYLSYNKQSNQKLGVNQHLGGNSSSGSRSSSVSPLASPSIASFSQRLIRSISSTSNTSNETIHDPNPHVQITQDNLKLPTSKLSPGLQLNTNRSLNHHQRFTDQIQHQDKLIVSTSVLLRDSEDRIKVGEIFWIEVVLVNPFERLRKTGVFEIGVIGNEIIGLDDMISIGPLEEGESGSVRIRCVAMKEGIWSVSVIMRRRNHGKQQIRLMDAVLVGVVA